MDHWTCFSRRYHFSRDNILTTHRRSGHLAQTWIFDAQRLAKQRGSLARVTEVPRVAVSIFKHFSWVFSCGGCRFLHSRKRGTYANPLTSSLHAAPRDRSRTEATHGLRRVSVRPEEKGNGKRESSKFQSTKSRAEMESNASRAARLLCSNRDLERTITAKKCLTGEK